MFDEVIVPLITLIALEVVLGIDNIVFISLLAGKLPPESRKKLRLWGLSLAMILRLGLLTVISWILKLNKELFSVLSVSISGKSMILLAGGMFLLYKSTSEILRRTEPETDTDSPAQKSGTFRRLLLEVMLLDLVFSIDSIITAVGMVKELWIMYTAVVCAVAIMMIAARPISTFIHKHPSFKILALCFLMMIGVTLFAEGLNFEIPKGYIYYSMAFAFLVDIIQLKKLKRK